MSYFSCQHISSDPPASLCDDTMSSSARQNTCAYGFAVAAAVGAGAAAAAAAGFFFLVFFFLFLAFFLLQTG